MEIGQRTGALTCPRCLRHKDEAIAEQLNQGCVCGDEKCIFKEQIEIALEERKASKFCCNCGTAYYSNVDLFCYRCGTRKI